MRSWRPFAATLILIACDASAVAPSGGSQPAHPKRPLATSALEAPALLLVSPGQLVMVERDGGETQRAWFEARLALRGGTGGDPTPVVDGAILVVSGSDGPMPQTSPDAETLRIDVRSAAVGSDGVVRFTGLATARNARGESAPFDVEGSVQPSAKCCDGPDFLIWDILGSNVHEMSFTAFTLMRVAGGAE